MLCAKHILDYWSKFGQFLLAQFFLEVHGLVNLPSASYLAFQCVWTAYAKAAGPLAQALEKCKAHHEALLRQESRGGFMFCLTLGTHVKPTGISVGHLQVANSCVRIPPCPMGSSVATRAI